MRGVTKKIDTLSVLVVGSGRWARILIKALVEDPRIGSVSIFSRRNVSGISSWLKLEREVDPTFGTNLQVIEHELNSSQLDKYDIGVIANYPAEHYEYARLLLQHKLNVLVEKPLSISLTQFTELVGLASKNNVVFAAGLEFMYSLDVSKLRTLRNSDLQKIEKVVFRWTDLVTEKRYGETKLPDPTIDTFVDLNPHAWSILNILFPNASCELIKLTTEVGGEVVKFVYKVANFFVEGHLERGGHKAQRIIEITDVNNESVAMDFTREPAKFLFNGIEKIGTYKQNKSDKSLARELKAFVDCVQDRSIVLVNEVKYLMELIVLEEFARKTIYKEQYDLIKGALEDRAMEAPDDAVINALKYHLTYDLIKCGAIDNPKSTDRIEESIRQCAYLIQSPMLASDGNKNNLKNKLMITEKRLVLLGKVIKESRIIKSLL
jgi:predicted dehydrogenase